MKNILLSMLILIPNIINCEEKNQKLKDAYLSWFNRIQKMEKALFEGADPNVHIDKDTLLMKCISEGYYNEAKLLLGNKANVDIKNEKGESLVDKVMEKSDYEKWLKLLLQYKININYRKNDHPLINAVSTGNVELVNILLEYEVKPENKDLYKALEEAVQKEHNIIIQILLEHGAVPNEKILQTAVDLDNSDLIKKIVPGVDPNTLKFNFKNSAILAYLIKNGLCLNERNRNGVPRFFTECCDSKALMIMLDNGLDITQKDYEGRTILHYKINQKMAKMCLDQGININTQDDNGDTPLHFAANLHFVSKKKIFIDFPDLMTRDECITQESIYQECELVDLFLQQGADVERKNKEGNTPLHKAAESATHKIIKILLQHNAQINVTNKLGETPLHIAAKASVFLCYYNYYSPFPSSKKEVTDILQFLIENGGEKYINQQDNYGNTPLDCALKAKQIMKIKLLLSYGAQLNSMSQDILDKLLSQNDDKSV